MIQVPAELGESSATCACPKCGGTTFSVSGFVGYTQVYDSHFNSYADYDVDGNSDFATQAVCLDCEADVTRLLRQQHVLDFFDVEPDEKRY